MIKPIILGTVYDSKCDNAFKAGHGAVYDGGVLPLPLLLQQEEEINLWQLMQRNTG